MAKQVKGNDSTKPKLRSKVYAHPDDWEQKLS
jgi:hypothetical protein